MKLINSTMSRKGIKIFGVIYLAIIAWVIHPSLMYTYKLAEFHEVDYSLLEHGVTTNGHTSYGDFIEVLDLAVIPTKGEGTANELCPNVSSERGYLTIVSVAGYTDVCCEVAENQFLVPFKDIGDQRHYLCGEWPLLDHVIQPIKKR
jgi:hypothetical protein